MARTVGIGHQDFGQLIRNNYFYVDKTALIRELLENWGKVNLFTRPRRFGKTLNMSMLENFFSPEKVLILLLEFYFMKILQVRKLLANCSIE